MAAMGCSGQIRRSDKDVLPGRTLVKEAVDLCVNESLRRTISAAQFRDLRRKARPTHRGHGADGFILAIATSDDPLTILGQQDMDFLRLESVHKLLQRLAIIGI